MKNRVEYEVCLPTDTWGDGFNPFVISRYHMVARARQLCREWGTSTDPDDRPTQSLELYIRDADRNELDELEYASGAAKRAATEMIAELRRDYHLGTLAAAATGMRYDSPAAQKLLSGNDWQGYWPVITGDGLLTGDITETENEGYLGNVNDMAMVRLDSLTDAQIEHNGGPDFWLSADWDGYVRL